MIFRLFFAMALVGSAYHYLTHRTIKVDLQAATAPASPQSFATYAAGSSTNGSVSPGFSPDTGFVTMPPPRSAKSGTVMVVTPPNCSSEVSRRASRLLDQLLAAGIPCQFTDSVNFTVVASKPAEVQRLKNFLSGPSPLVFLQGTACSNPSAQQVIAEYKNRTMR